MKKPSYLPVTAIIIVILLAASFCYSLTPTAHAGSSDTEWHLTVTGFVEHPLNLTLSDLFAMPKTTIDAPIICAGPPPSFVTRGNWTGVRLWLLLQEAGVLNGAIKVAFYAQDGFTTDLTIEMAQRDDVIIAYEKDGMPLNEKLRLVVPNSWGYKWISQLTRIELVPYNFLGLYESKGYSDSGSFSEPIQQPTPPAEAEIETSGFLPIDFYIILAAIIITIGVAVVLVIKNRVEDLLQFT